MTLAQLLSNLPDAATLKGLWLVFDGEINERLKNAQPAYQHQVSTLVDFTGPFSIGQVQYRGSSGKLFNLIGTVDIENQATSNAIEVSIKLAINDILIDASQCNATIPGNGIGKLHSMWLTSLNENDEVSMWIACPDGSHTVVPVRWRFQATSLL